MAPKLHKNVINETYDIVAHGISRWSAKIEISGWFFGTTKGLFCKTVVCWSYFLYPKKKKRKKLKIFECCFEVFHLSR